MDKIFLLSPKECGLSCPTAENYNTMYSDIFDAEGAVYEWFENNSDNNLCSWLRSPSAQNNTDFFFCSYDRPYYYYDANSPTTVCPAFVIG